jgi:hypothetical protein
MGSKNVVIISKGRIWSKPASSGEKIKRSFTSCHHFEGAHLVKACTVWRGDQVILHQGRLHDPEGHNVTANTKRAFCLFRTWIKGAVPKEYQALLPILLDFH